MGSRLGQGLFGGCGDHLGKVGVGHGVGVAGRGDGSLEIVRFGWIAEADPGYLRGGWRFWGAVFAQAERDFDVASDWEVGPEGGAGVDFAVRDPREVFGLREDVVAGIKFIMQITKLRAITLFNKKCVNSA